MNQTLNIETKFFITWEEYYQAWQFFRRHRTEIARENIAAVVLILTGLLIWMFGGHGLFVIVGIVAGALAFIGSRWLQRNELRRRFTNEPLHQTEHAVSFAEDGIHYTQGHVESNLPWNFYQRLVESDEGFLLVCGDDVFSLIPRRAFADEQSINEFRSLATKKLRRKN